jgi:hypothetical protein
VLTVGESAISQSIGAVDLAEQDAAVSMERLSCTDRITVWGVLSTPQIFRE